jgi:hypothetical protein
MKSYDRTLAEIKVKYGIEVVTGKDRLEMDVA